MTRRLPQIEGAQLVAAGNRAAAGEALRAHCPKIVIWLALALAFGILATTTMATFVAAERAHHIAARV